MADKQDIIKAIRDIATKKQKLFVFGTVEAINKQDFTISVRDFEDDLVYENISLSKGFTLIPAIGTLVMACVVNISDSDGFMVWANDIIEVIQNIDGTAIEVNKDGLVYHSGDNHFEITKEGKMIMENSEFSLKTLLNNIVAQCEQIKTTTAIGMQPPLNAAAFTLIKNTDIDKILQ